ncbi:PaaX family transcriptional regulator [Geodermatophilus sp. SYSU D00815]
MTVTEEAAAGAGLQPRQLIVTLYGLWARQRGGWLSVASIVRLMADLGVDEPAVRSSISRLKRRGLLVARPVAGVAGYALSDDALELLAEGDARIFGRRRAEVADGWLTVVFSVPESERDQRHRLRAELTRLGCGTVAPGAWIAPGHLADEVTEVLHRRGLDGYAELFAGRHVGSGDLAAKVARWWDLDALQARYAEFLERQEPVRRRWTAGTAFADHVRLVTDWRRLPYADPGLPLALLPTNWNGARAAELFAELSAVLAAPAGDHVTAVLGRDRAPGTESPVGEGALGTGSP